jgi:uncharacterized protein (DUF924 family)
MDKMNEILDFWFDNVEPTKESLLKREEFWFKGGEEVDNLIRGRFEDDIHNAAAGQYKGWEETPKGMLALIILLDQFPRNIYRNTPESYEFDPLALDLCLKGLEKEMDRQLELIERVFFYLPLEHSESLDLQNRSVREFKTILDLTPPEIKEPFELFHDFAVRHLGVIEQFGRFPHRNEILDRPSTSAERTFLTSPSAPF